MTFSFLDILHASGSSLHSLIVPTFFFSSMESETVISFIQTMVVMVILCLTILVVDVLLV